MANTLQTTTEIFGDIQYTRKKDNISALIICRRLESLPINCLERAKELKALFGSLLQKPDRGIMERDSKKTEKLSLNVDEPLKWKESFENLLSSQYGLCLFRAFLVSEFSEENIAFYLACEDYRTTNASKLAAKAKKIYDEFICSNALREVNIDHETKAITKKNMEQPSQSCFLLAQVKIYTLMEKDCYPRFLKSSTYLEFSRAAKNGWKTIPKTILSK